MTPLTLILPWPPSANRYWRSINGRAILSRDARTYKRTVAGIAYAETLAIGHRGFDTEPLDIAIIANPPDRRRRDLDNLLKALLDAMQYAGLYANDSQCRRLTITWGDVITNGQLTITISRYTPP